MCLRAHTKGPLASARGGDRRACTTGLLLAALFCLAPAESREAAAAAQAKSPGEAVAGAVRSLDLQTELPRERGEPGSHLQLPPELFWLALIGGLGVLVYSFWDELPIWRIGWRRQWSDGPEDGLSPATKAPEEVAAAAVDLARQGRFGEAMHALLLQSLADVRRRLDEQFADSLTSREILRNTRLPSQGREPLRDIIARVERTYFGEYAAGPQDYMACRERFTELARVLQAASPA